MLGASARYSCCNAPVETITAPRRRSKLHIAPPAAARQVSLIPLLLLSPPNPLTLGFGGVSFLQASYLSLPPGGESSIIPLRLLSKAEPLALGSALGFGFLAKSALLRFHLAVKTAPASLRLLSPPNPLTLGFGGVSFLQASYLSLPPGGESSTISLRLLSKVGPLMLGSALVLRAWKGCPRCSRRLGR